MDVTHTIFSPALVLPPITNRPIGSLALDHIHRENSLHTSKNSCNQMIEICISFTEYILRDTSTVTGKK